MYNKNNATKKTKKLFRWDILIRSIKTMFKYFPAGAVFVVVVIVLQGLIPVLNVNLISKTAQTMIDNSFIVNGDTVILGLLVAISMCLDFICSDINHLLRTRMSFQMEFNLRDDMIRHVEKLDIRYREKNEYHVIVSRASNAISPHTMFSFLDMLGTVVSAVISLVGITILLFQTNVIIPFINLFMLITSISFSAYFSKKANRFYEEINQDERLLSNMSSWFTTENSNAEIRIFRSFYWFKKTWSDLYFVLNKKKNMFFDKIELQQGLVNTIFTTLPVISILIYLMMLSFHSNNVAYDVITIFNSCMVMTTNAIMLSYSFGSLSEMLINYENYFRLFDIKSDGVRKEGEISTPSSIEIDRVSFCYNDDENAPKAVKEVSVKLESGKVYALVGYNGSGKTTLAKLIMKLYHPTKGTVKMLDKHGKETELRTSAVMQDFMRYDFTLKDNITFGDYSQAKDEKRYQTAVQSGECGGVLKKIGEDTILGTRFGEINLSGGEWQRVAVARGLFRSNSSVVVFDEPNSNIDAIAESKIIRNMIQENKDKICVFITHRLATVKFADQILVMKNGELIEIGSHEELMKGDTEYKQMFSSQIEWYQ